MIVLNILFRVWMNHPRSAHLDCLTDSIHPFDEFHSKVLNFVTDSTASVSSFLAFDAISSSDIIVWKSSSHTIWPESGKRVEEHMNQCRVGINPIFSKIKFWNIKTSKIIRLGLNSMGLRRAAPNELRASVASEFSNIQLES